MGSLMVAIVQLLQNMVNRARRQGEQSMVLCILECLLYYIERFAKYFNKVSRRSGSFGGRHVPREWVSFLLAGSDQILESSQL